MTRRKRTAFRPFTALLTLTLLPVALLTGSATAAAQAQYFTDDFDDGNADGWATVSGSWSVAGDVFRQDDTAGGLAVAGDDRWTDYNLAVDVTTGDLASGGVGLLARYSDDGHYAVRLSADRVDLIKQDGDQATTVDSRQLSLEAGTTYTVDLEVRSDYIKAYVDHDLAVQGYDASQPAGRVGLASWGTTADFDNVRVGETLELGTMRANLHTLGQFFAHRFEAGTAPWRPVAGAWQVVEGDAGMGEKDNHVFEGAADETGSARALAGQSTWTDYTMRTAVIPAGRWSGRGAAVLQFRYTDEDNYYAVHLGAGTATLVRRSGGVEETVRRARLPHKLEAGTPVFVEIEAYGSSINIFVDNTKTIAVSDADGPSAGRIGLGADDATVRFDDVELSDKNAQLERLDTIKASGMNRVRLTHTHVKYLHATSEWIRHANSIGLEVLLSLSYFRDPAYYPPGTEKVYENGNFPVYRLSDLDPERFARAYRGYLRHFREHGAQLTAIAFANEPGWAFNGDLRFEGPWIFDLGTSWNDPKFVPVRDGILRFGETLRIARTVTDQLYPRGGPRLVSGGLNHSQQAFIESAKRATVRPALFLQVLQGTHPEQPAGSPDYLSAVDDIGVHLYPFGWDGRSYDVDPETGYQSAVAFVNEIMDPIVSVVGENRSFAVLETGYKRDNVTRQGHLMTEEERRTLFLWFARALQDRSLDDVDWSVIYIYNFDATAHAFYEDGALLPSADLYTHYPY